MRGENRVVCVPLLVPVHIENEGGGSVASCTSCKECVEMHIGKGGFQLQTQQVLTYYLIPFRNQGKSYYDYSLLFLEPVHLLIYIQ